MAFMRPSYTQESFHVGESRTYGRIAIPADVYGNLERFMTETRTCGAELVTGKWWVRLSAPGYMDCTEWDGPHDTEADARAAISEAYDVDSDTGDDVDDEDSNANEGT